MEGTAGLPDGIRARPIEKADAEAWAVLLGDAERVDDQGENWDADDLVELLDDPRMQPAEYSVGLWSGAQLAGACFVRDMPDPRGEHRINSGGTVHPRFRRHGLGGWLLGWAGDRARLLHAERGNGLPAELRIGSIESNTGLLTMLERAGFERCRYFSGMERDLGDPVLPQPPDGMRLIAFDPAYDEPTRVTHNEAFLDHWSFDPRDRQFWERYITGARAFRPELSHLLIVDDPEPVVAAYALGYEYVADTAATGVRELYFGQIGTRRAYRGRGAASAVITASLAAGTAAGFQRAALGVDADSPTGAVGLYEHLGFVVQRRWISHRRPLG